MATEDVAPPQAYDSDEEPMHARRDKLDWRLDPSLSFSDWTIEVSYLAAPSGEEEDATTSTTTMDVYHVHRNVLAVGGRRSEYFVTLFQGRDFAEDASQTSRIPLHPLAAASFPAMLDYVYGKPLQIDTQSAAALYHLAGYFGMRLLRYETKRFWTRDLSLENCVTYYEHSRIFTDDKIYDSVVHLCAKKVIKVSASSTIVQITPPEFWVNVLKHRCSIYKHPLRIAPDPDARHISLIVTQVIELLGNSLEETLFAELTNCNHLPRVDPLVALPLMKCEASLGTSPGASTFSNLQDRCLDALADGWEDPKTVSREVSTDLVNLNPLLLSELLQRCLERARTASRKRKAPGYAPRKLARRYYRESGDSDLDSI